MKPFSPNKKQNLFSSGHGTELRMVSGMDVVAAGSVAHPLHWNFKNVFKSAYFHLSDLRLLPPYKWILLFWDVTWHSYQCSRSTHRSHL